MSEELKKIWKKYNLNIDKLSDRVIFQKTIYILKKFGFDGLEKYSYSLYHYGPYSTILTKDLYAIKEKEENFEEIKLIFNEEQEKAMNKFEEIKSKLDESLKNIAEDVRMEFVADILYRFENGMNDKEMIFDFLKKHQTYLNDRTSFETIWTILKDKAII